MTKLEKIKCTIIVVFCSFFIFAFIFYIKNFYCHFFPARDDMLAIFFGFKFCDSRFINHIIEASIGYIPMFLFNKHPFDYTGEIYSYILSSIYFCIIVCMFFNIWLLYNKKINNKIIVSFIIIALSGFYLFDYVIINPQGICESIEYLLPLAVFSLFWGFFLYYGLNDKNENKLLLFSAFISAFCLGISVEMLNILTSLMLLLHLFYFLIFRKNLFSDEYKNKKALIVLILGFIIGLICYYNPIYLQNGIGDRGCVSYEELYNSLVLLPNIYINYFNSLVSYISNSYIFICLLFFSIFSYIPALKIKTPKKHIIIVYIVSMLIFLSSLILITDLSENQNSFWFFHNKFRMIFQILSFMYLMYSIVIFISCINMKNKNNTRIKLALILIVFILICSSLHINEYKISKEDYIMQNSNIKKNRYITEKFYIHYLKQNKTAILPISCMDGLEYHRAKILGKMPGDIHNDTFLPLYNSLNCLYLILYKDHNGNKNTALPGYKFVDDKTAYKLYYTSGGKVIDLNNINFTSLLNMNFSKDKMYRKILFYGVSNVLESKSPIWF